MEAHERPAPPTLTLGICPSGEGLNIGPFSQVFGARTILRSTEDVQHVDAVILWGGMDVGSSYYGEKPHTLNQQQDANGSLRDAFEWSIIKTARGLNKPLIGVCRGAQFLCAAAGGKLVQHMPISHRRTHEIWVSGQKMYAACDHHQAMIIKDVPDAAMFAWHDDGTPEVVYFPSLKALAIQPHPEWMGENTEFVIWAMDKVRQLVNSTLTVEEKV